MKYVHKLDLWYRNTINSLYESFLFVLSQGRELNIITHEHLFLFVKKHLIYLDSSLIINKISLLTFPGLCHSMKPFISWQGHPAQEY